MHYPTAVLNSFFFLNCNSESSKIMQSTVKSNNNSTVLKSVLSFYTDSGLCETISREILHKELILERSNTPDQIAVCWQILHRNSDLVKDITPPDSSTCLTADCISQLMNIPVSNRTPINTFNFRTAGQSIGED